MKLLNSKRNTLLELPYPIKESYEYELILDPSVSLKTVNKEIHKNTAVGRLDIMIRQNGNKIQVIKNIEIDKSLITPAEYSNFRDLMTTWFSQANENIILH